jgi:alkylation response protein AidB-like acyl-CoA dehydrogenase
LVETIRELVQQKIKPYYLENDFSADKDFDWYLIRLLGELNLICSTIPREYGGLGLDMLTIALIMEELAIGCPGLTAIVQANIHSVQPILLAGSKEQKAYFLPKLTGKNACLNSFALTEQSSGSDINSMSTFAGITPGGYIINGSKDYILNAREAQYITVFAFCDTLHKMSSMRCYIIPTTNPGISIGDVKHMATLGYSRVAEVVFDNVKLEPQMVLKSDQLFSGYLLLSQTLDIGRVLTGATAVGIARAAYDLAYDFANRRMQCNKPIRDHQVIAHSLADMATKIEVARLITWKACWLVDKGDDFTMASAMAKLTATTIALQVVTTAAEILGARALIEGSEMERLLRDARIQQTIEGTNHIQRNIIVSLL